MERMPIDVKLWALVSGTLLVGLACVDSLSGFGDDSASLGSTLRKWRSASLTDWGLVEKITPRLLLFAVVAFFVGWALHGVAVICGVRFVRVDGEQNYLDYENPNDLEVVPGKPWEERLARLAELRREGELLSRGRAGRERAETTRDDSSE